MAVCLCHVETIVRNQFFFIDFMVKEGKTYLVIDAPVHDKHDGTRYNPVGHFICMLRETARLQLVEYPQAQAEPSK